MKNKNQTSQIMKKILCLAASLLALNLTPGFGQPSLPNTPAPTPGPSFQQRLQTIQRLGAPQADAPTLTKFNLDFPGGTPAQLVAAIEQAMGKPLNVIISTDEKSAKAKLPPIKVSELDVAKLFKTLQENSKKYGDGGELLSQFGFYTLDTTPSDNSLWTFSAYEKKSALTQFSLDFPGGTPVQLVKAIEQAMGKPLNVIINKEDENVELPPLKMDNVYLPQLFTALEVASRKVVAVSTGFSGSYSQFTSGYGFKTADNTSDTAVWYFHVEKPSMPPVVSTQKTCQFYSLSPYLDRGFTVDDITTAIQTGWKMSGETSLPELNYHKETKLLIAYGEPDKLRTIDSVLRTLPSSNATRTELDGLWVAVHNLQAEMGKLKPASAPTPAPAGSEDKSGK
jgi:hypothetical protein